MKFAAAINPIAEEGGTLGVMKYTAKAGENVDTDKIGKCKEHPLSVNGVSAVPDQAGLEKRECWYGDDYGCQKGYCYQKCGGDGEWCWSAWGPGTAGSASGGPAILGSTATLARLALPVARAAATPAAADARCIDARCIDVGHVGLGPFVII